MSRCAKILKTIAHSRAGRLSDKEKRSNKEDALKLFCNGIDRPRGRYFMYLFINPPSVSASYHPCCETRNGMSFIEQSFRDVSEISVGMYVFGTGKRLRPPRRSSYSRGARGSSWKCRKVVSKNRRLPNITAIADSGARNMGSIKS